MYDNTYNPPHPHPCPTPARSSHVPCPTPAPAAPTEDAALRYDDRESEDDAAVREASCERGGRKRVSGRAALGEEVRGPVRARAGALQRFRGLVSRL